MALVQHTIAEFATQDDTANQNKRGFEVLTDDDAQESEMDADNYELRDGDSRELIMQQIRKRRGGKEFRKLLCERFEGKCVVTKCKIVAVLEAAHIKPYRGVSDNDIKNGLLLRADIHTLFDLNLLGVEPQTWIVRIHPKIRETYAEFEGRQLVMPPGGLLLQVRQLHSGSTSFKSA
ncbi:MAG TPA: HNH endonuclease [Planctomycetaceae bacterium]|nr:HNH endonuclease [Planctomycetaceae bacterium]HQZ64421.1 HNH endonuclease [Planctomycetaceae bacterium]